MCRPREVWAACGDDRGLSSGDAEAPCFQRIRGFRVLGLKVSGLLGWFFVVSLTFFWSCTGGCQYGPVQRTAREREREREPDQLLMHGRERIMS